MTPLSGGSFLGEPDGALGLCRASALICDFVVELGLSLEQPVAFAAQHQKLIVGVRRVAW